MSQNNFMYPLNRETLNSIDIAFIVGRGRSGTSLLHSMLNAHPAIQSVPESMFISYLFRRYRHACWSDNQLIRFCRDLFSESRMRSWKLDGDELLRGIRRINGNIDLSLLIKAVYHSYALQNGASECQLIVDKNPGYSLFIPELLDILPTAKFIHIVRDPRANVLSFQTVPFDAKGAATLAYRWIDYNIAIMRCRELYPKSFIEVRYEDLVSDPASQARRTCEFLSIEFNEVMCQQQRGVLDADRSSAWHKNLQQNISAVHVDKWRSGLSMRQQRVICSITRQLAQSFRYEIDDVDLTFSEEVQRVCGAVTAWSLYRAEQFIIHAPLWAKKGIIDSYRFISRSLDSVK